MTWSRSLIGARCAPFRLTSRRFADAFDGLAVHQTGVDRVADRECNVLSGDLAGADRCRCVSGFHRTRQHLIRLLQYELATRHCPPSCQFRRNDPEIGGAKTWAVVGDLDLV